MKKIIVLFLILVSFESYGQRLVDANTFNHWTAGATVGGLVSANFGKNNNHRVMLGLFSGMVAGTMKEIIDNNNRPGSGDFGDIIATTAGGFVGGLISNAAVGKGLSNVKKISYLCIVK
jgi:uncharacterized membrane protein YeaQ/YmgE (transglycosylase-associated protein family)